MQGAPSDRSWLERHILPITIGLVAFVFLLAGLLLGGVFSGQGENEAAPPTSATTSTSSTSSNSPTTQPTITTTAATTTTTLITPTLPPSGPPDFVVTAPGDAFFIPAPLHVGESVDLDTFTVPCTDGCDVELIEVLGMTSDGYTAVVAPVGGAQMALLPPPDPNAPSAEEGILAALAVCQDGIADLDTIKRAVVASPEQDPFLCVRTDEGNWSVLIGVEDASTSGAPVLFAGMTLAPPGWTLERSEAFL